MDSETSMRARHWAIRNECDFSSMKKWKNEFQIFESASSDSSLSMIIVKRRTLRAVEREREPSLVRVFFFGRGAKDSPNTAGSTSQQVKSNALSAGNRRVSRLNKNRMARTHCHPLGYRR
jgi:hypothetical protein